MNDKEKPTATKLLPRSCHRIRLCFEIDGSSVLSPGFCYIRISVETQRVGMITKKRHLSNVENAVAGGGAGFITRCICQPLDVVKIRFQLQVNSGALAKYKTVSQSLFHIAKEESILALWKGHIPAQYLSVAYGAAQFSSYKYLIKLAEPYKPADSNWADSVMHFTTGGMSGVIASVVSFPLDVIRTRLIAQGEPKLYQGMMDATVQIYKQEGLKGYYRGLIPGCIQVAPTMGLVFGFQNFFKHLWLCLTEEDLTILDFHKPMAHRKLSNIGHLTTGLLAGFCAKTLVYPLDLIKKRLQMQGIDKNRMMIPNLMQCSGVLECMTLTVQKEGVRGLFKGLYPSILKAGATTAIYIASFNYLCDLIEAHHS